MEDELRLKGWEDLHALWHLCARERNLLVTEMSWRKIPKNFDEQILMNVPRGSDKEEDVHRLRYNEVSSRTLCCFSKPVVFTPPGVALIIRSPADSKELETDQASAQGACPARAQPCQAEDNLHSADGQVIIADLLLERVISAWTGCPVSYLTPIELA